MGKHWGELGYLRGIISYGISPYEHNVFVGIFSGGLSNLLRRIYGSFFVITFPAGISFSVYVWANLERERSIRKAALYPHWLDDAEDQNDEF